MHSVAPGGICAFHSTPASLIAHDSQEARYDAVKGVAMHIRCRTYLPVCAALNISLKGGRELLPSNNGFPKCSQTIDLHKLERRYTSRTIPDAWLTGSRVVTDWQRMRMRPSRSFDCLSQLSPLPTAGASPLLHLPHLR